MITNPIANIPINKRSHVYGWAKKWSDLLEEKIDHKCELDHEKTYIEHGANLHEPCTPQQTHTHR